MSRLPRTILAAAVLVGAGAAVAAYVWQRPAAGQGVLVPTRKYTIDSRLAELGDATARVRRHCSGAGISYPPRRVVLLGLKDERRIEVYAGEDESSLRQIATHPILAASGTLGPKLREGDLQVPEGVYQCESLNPNSRFHVALRVGYPSAFDRRVAAAEHRANLGGDIMIHGGAASIGCLAMGDDVAEELFVLAARAGLGNVKIVLSPVDLRTHPLPPELNTGWRRELYVSLKTELARLPR